jgi:hypothetical protein
MTRSELALRLRTTASPLDYFKLAVWIGMVVVPWTIIALICFAYFG